MSAAAPPTADLVQFEIEGGVARLTLDDPKALNAVSMPMLRGIGAALDEIEKPANHVRCVLLTGAGGAFCAGANLAASDPGGVSGDDGQLDVGRVLDESYHPVLRRLRDLHCPLVVAVNGVAAGAGMSFAMMGDIVLAARSASFVQAFVRRGLVPDCGSTFLLPRLVGFGRALELAMRGQKITAGQALEWGMVNHVFDDDELMDEAQALVAELAAGPTVALGLIRRAYWASRDNGFEEQLQVERELQREAGRSQDFVEGVKSFLQKRPPEFTGH
ncbi:MAG: enoyl-CoA hydratase/isomerase [Deltaproteobacteria bacterium]|nr:enoyl-CoA hydratase/isomerase [Deltaproteobacteria bacterium]